MDEEVNFHIKYLKLGLQFHLLAIKLRFIAYCVKPSFEECRNHWFFCKENLQKKRVLGGHSNSLKNLGFVTLINQVKLNPTLLWSNGWSSVQGFVEDGLETWIEKNEEDDSEEISTRSWMFNAVYDVLKEEYGTAMVAIGTWTDDVISSFENMEKRRKHSPYCSRTFNGLRRVEPKPEDKCCAHVESLELLYSPRPFSWNGSCDFAKMWRVAVLNPRLNKVNRDGMAHQLKETANKSSVDIGAVEVRIKPWPGFSVATKLLQYDLYCTELRTLCQGMVDVLPEVCVSNDEDLNRSNMQTSVGENVEDCSKSIEEKAEDDQMDATVSQLKTEIKPQQTAEDNLDAVAASFASSDLHESSAKTSDLQLIPRCLKCGDLLCDVNTYIAVAEALEIYGQDVYATYLSCAVSFALLKFYHSCVGNKFQFCVSEKQSNQSRDDAFMYFSPLSLPNVALLYRIISRKPDIVENWWLNLNKARKSGSGETSVLESISSSESFVFQVGVMGFLTVRTPSATLDLEGAIFHHGKWLIHQLMESSPLDTDLTFLSHCVSAMLNIPSQLTLCISLAHLLFHHLFKECSQIESFETLTTAQKFVIKSAISIFRSSIPHTKNIESQCFFLGVMWRKAASFAKDVLQETATCSSLHERVCETLVQPSGLFGDISLVRQGPRLSNTKANYIMTLFYWQRSIRCLAMALLPSLSEVEKQGTNRSESKEERTRVLRKTQVSLLIHALLMHKLQKQSNAPLLSVGHRVHSLATTEIRAIRDTVWSNLLSVLKDGNFEENVKILLDLPRYSMDVFTANEVLQICDQLLKGVQSRQLAQTVLTEYVKCKMDVNDDNGLLEVVDCFERSRYGSKLYGGLSIDKDERRHLLPAVCQQLISLSSCSSRSVLLLSIAALQLSKYTQFIVEHKRQSSATAGEKTAEEEVSRLHETLVNLCVSFLHCINKKWQTEKYLSRRELKIVEECLNDICSSLLDVGKRSVRDREHYVDKFLTASMTTIESPKWMFQIVEKIAPFFKVDEKASVRNCYYNRESEIRESCKQSLQLKKLLERCRKAFEDLLRGPEVNQKLQQVSQEEPFDGKAGPFAKTWKEKQALNEVKLSDGLTLSQCLMLTKRVHLSLCDAETNSFHSLFKELEGRHPVLSVIARDYIYERPRFKIT